MSAEIQSNSSNKFVSQNDTGLVGDFHYRVLMVEDEEFTRILLTETLAKAGAWTMTFASAVPGSTHINLCGSTESPPICPTLVINVVQAPEDPAPAEIPEWQQSVGRPNATSTCDEGWQPSWQEWAQPITGGWVCTRSIPSLGD